MGIKDSEIHSSGGQLWEGHQLETQALGSTIIATSLLAHLDDGHFECRVIFDVRSLSDVNSNNFPVNDRA